MALESKPCIIVLTETKLTELEQDRRMLNTCLPDYKLYHSRVKGQKTGKLRTGSAGVTIAVHTSLTTQNSVQLINLDHPAAKGHCKYKIQPPKHQEVRPSQYGEYMCHAQTCIQENKSTACCKKRCRLKTGLPLKLANPGRTTSWQET